MPDTIAAVDVGTNSLHLLVARTTGEDRFEVVTREREMVRLGAGPDGMRRLAPEAVERAVAALARFRRIADAHSATLRAVATSAMREAENRDELLERARREAGIDIEVISGIEEARLIHLGVLQALEVFDRRLLLVDIGGGSTELLLGERGETIASTSLKLGAVRLTRRFFPEGRADPDAVDSCRRHIESSLITFVQQIDGLGHEVAVGCSGTIEQVLRLARGLTGEDPLRTLNGAVLTRKAIRSVVGELITARSEGTTGDLPDLDPKREDIILAGALILEGIVENLGIKQLLISEHALREGVLADTIQRDAEGTVLRLRDVSRRSVTDLVSAWDPDPGHAEHVSHLALGLFDATAHRHGLGAEARALLEAGSLLANVGLVIAHSQHHKHSYYLIRNSDRLVGFTDREIEIVALIARYHRRSAPKARHAEWSALDDEDRRLVEVAAGILRVAVGCDRSRAAAVVRIAVDDRGDELILDLEPITEGADISLERWAADRRSGLLGAALGVPIRVDDPERR